MWIDWDLAAAIALVLAVGVALTRNVEGGRLVGVRTTARELALVLFLYAVWQWAHDLTVTKVDGARENALWLYDLQHDLHIPDELTLQQAVLPHGWLVQLFNGYYAIVHVPALIALLIWLFWRHRDRYGWIRNTLALTTMGCLLVHAIPMAPPRMFPELGLRGHRAALRAVGLRARRERPVQPAGRHAVGPRGVGPDRRAWRRSWPAPAGGAGSWLLHPVRDGHRGHGRRPTTGTATASWRRGSSSSAS